jgi:hypothetical protein
MGALCLLFYNVQRRLALYDRLEALYECQGHGSGIETCCLPDCVHDMSQDDKLPTKP